jgi:cytochrome b subunit of formate dehydrogenase
MPWARIADGCHWPDAQSAEQPTSALAHAQEHWSAGRPPASGTRNWARIVAVALTLLALAAVVPRAAAVALSPTDIENHRCLNCHGQADIGQLDPAERRSMIAASGPPAASAPPTRPQLYIGPNALADSVHEHVACTDCHRSAGQLPHAEHLGTVACASACHTTQGPAYRQSIHAAAAAAGKPAPTCATCHGGHDIYPKTDHRSRTNPLNAIKICGGCHEQQTGKTPAGFPAAKFVATYLDSVHGKAITEGGLLVAATCGSCHDSHSVLPASDPRSKVNRANLATTCGQCHYLVAKSYEGSIHGQKLAAGDPNAPVCSDCHTAHAIERTNTPGFMLDIVNECGQCHDKPRRDGGRSLYATYRASYHGQVTKLGSTRAARCSDCHGSHDIQPINDPASRLFGPKRIEVCRHCHADAPARFAQFAPHGDYRDGTRFPLLHAVWLYFVVLMSCSFGFFGLHSVLWLVRSLVYRLRHGPTPHIATDTHAIARFSRTDRINHAFLMVSFFGLTLTGMPLFFSDKPWARMLAGVFGGVAAAGVYHRIFAVMFAGNLVVHVVGLIRRRQKHAHRRLVDWLFGPTSMLPSLRDLRDVIAMARWFFGRGRKPTFDRWTYWEKFDYWAEIGGTFIIGGSGLLLWFPVFFAHFLPGWVFNVATIAHGYEALLAVGFIFTIHFFNAHLRPEKFPVDDVMFTGRLSEAEFKHERGLEYARLVEQGKLDSLRVPPAPSWQRPVAVAAGVVALAIGTTMVVLIILAGLGLM